MDRLDLHEELVGVLGNRRVYYQPPSSTKITYECIVYNLNDAYTKRASNQLHHLRLAYDVIYMCKTVDDEIVPKMLEKFKMASFVSYYQSDGIHNYKFKIYF